MKLPKIFLTHHSSPPQNGEITAYAASRTPNAATIATIQNPKKGKATARIMAMNTYFIPPPYFGLTNNL